MNEEDFLPLSAIAQYGYCPRRAGWMLLEQSWADNIHTVEGMLEHERVHEGGADNRRDIAELHSVAVRSLRLGVSGSIDCVELRRDPDGYGLKNRTGRWKLRPVEYKHGAVRSEREYELQLCAQAIALEEMLHCEIEEGDLFYYDDHRRVAVPFTPQLRGQTLETAQKLHGICPRTGAWIETDTPARSAGAGISAPAWGRGLKHGLEKLSLR